MVIFVTAFTGPLETPDSDFIAEISVAMNEPKVNIWHQVIDTHHYIGDGKIIFEDYVRKYTAYAATGNGEKLSDDLKPAVLAAITSIGNMDCEGPYKIIEFEGITYDIMWWPIDEE